MSSTSGAGPAHDTDRPAGRAATGLLRVATLVLPRGVSRTRYRREFAAELYGQPRHDQLAYALSASAHMWSLRTVLIHGTETTRIPFLCRSNLHHRWTNLVNDVGVPFQTCSRCDRERGSLDGDGANYLFLPIDVGSTNH